MKSRFKFMLLLIAVCFSGYVNAQSKLTEEQKKEMKAKYEEYKTRLNLSEAQEAKVKDINATYLSGLAELKGSEGSKLSRFKTFRKLSDEKDKQMKAVLDQNQYETYKKMQEQMREELKSKRKQ